MVSVSCFVISSPTSQDEITDLIVLKVNSRCSSVVFKTTFNCLRKDFKLKMNLKAFIYELKAHLWTIHWL